MHDRHFFVATRKGLAWRAWRALGQPVPASATTQRCTVRASTPAQSPSAVALQAWWVATRVRKAENDCGDARRKRAGALRCQVTSRWPASTADRVRMLVVLLGGRYIKSIRLRAFMPPSKRSVAKKAWHASKKARSSEEQTPEAAEADADAHPEQMQVESIGPSSAGASLRACRALLFLMADLFRLPAQNRPAMRWLGQGKVMHVEKQGRHRRARAEVSLA